MAMKLELIGNELIKPASPTPDNRRTVQLSILDLSFPPVYVATIFFYNNDDQKISEDIVSLRLKKSLSETLTRFYPLAGRIEGASINCNDEGAVFIEARADCLLSDFLRNPDPCSLKQVVPSEFITSGDPTETWPLLHVKVTFFRSGGLAIGICNYHKTCDGASISTLVRGWTATAKGFSDAVIPEFTASTIYPPADPLFRSPVSMINLFNVARTCVAKRFIFDAAKIVELKYKAASETVPNPTRIEAVTTLIWRCATKASRSNSSILRPSGMIQAMDLRHRSRSTHLTRNTIGNLITAILVKEDPESRMEIHEIVAKLRKTTDEVNDMIKENLQGDRIPAIFSEKMAKWMVNLCSESMLKMDIYTFTSWCRMGFYEADFGWGSPVWVTRASHTLNKNVVNVLLMDTKDSEGIEAWVSLPEQDMHVFEHDQELLAFATLNPTVFI